MRLHLRYNNTMSNSYLKFLGLFCCFFWNCMVAQTVYIHPFLDSTISAWHQFSVQETGVQKITSGFLKQLGIPVENIDPKTIRVFGRGGQMLPLKNADEVETLYENAIWVVGEEDGSFDSEDYILFMGYGGDTWNDESHTFRNLYHESANYYITYGTSYGKRVLVQEGEKISSGDVVHSGIYKTAIEKDKYNIGNLGRQWFGERFFDQKSESYTLQTPNVYSGEKISVVARVAAAASKSTSFSLTVGSKNVNKSISPTSDITVAEPTPFEDIISGTLLSLEAEPVEAITAEISYASDGDFGANGYLDFIMAQYRRELLGSGDSFLFTLNPSSTAQKLSVSDAKPSTSLWELATNKVHITPATEQDLNAEVTTDAESAFYLSTDYKTPTYRRRSRKLEPSVLMQNVAKTSAITYLLITTEQYRKEAERLVNYRRENPGLQAVVVTLEEIYEAFSTGQQDIAAIRNFIRYLYFTQSKQLKYLCLFGDTSYDYKNHTGTSDMVVPTFHSLKSFSLANSYMSDDFFTMMDTSEGLLGSLDKMDIAVGRMLFTNAKEAADSVNKVIEYENPENIGDWINTYTILSDDADYTSSKDDYNIQVRLDELGDKLISEKPILNINKIHADYFQQVSSSGGDRYPEAQKKLINSMISGSLVVNYFGHGGEDGLASELLVDKNMASTLFHPGKYPLFNIITCEFTRFDNHERKTAGELLYQNPVGGAIGLITTTRQIIVQNGIAYNKIISKYLLAYGKDEYTSVAEALRNAKRDFSDPEQKRIIFYVGDPALKLHIPKRDVRVTHLNGVLIENLTENERQLKALDRVTLSGAVYDETNQKNTAFSGTVNTLFFDKEIERTTRGNDQDRKFKFKEQGNKIFSGLSSVKAGEFEASFVVPKDISLGDGKARISLVAFNNDKSEYVGGFSESLKIGGLNPNPVDDNKGPDVQVYLDDREFVDGDSVFNSPWLLIDLADENGINTSGGIGHDITAVLDGNRTNPYVLNSYYTTELDDFTKGTLNFPLNDLAIGEHTLTVRAWDTHNNPSTKTITFSVVENSSIQIEKVFNSPNPFTDQTTFFVQHNRPRELLQAKLYIFTTDGKRVWHDDQVVFSSGYMLDVLSWDGTTYSGNKLNKGTFLYTIELISTLSQSTDMHSGKLIIN
jgi:hypothetical protein